MKQQAGEKNLVTTSHEYFNMPKQCFMVAQERQKREEEDVEGKNLSKNVLSKPSNDIRRVVKLVMRRYIERYRKIYDSEAMKIVECAIIRSAIRATICFIYPHAVE